MKSLFGACAAVAATMFLTSGTAQAQPILTQRCNTDSLDPAQAERRINWARRCGLDVNVRSTSAGFDSGMPANGGGNLVEYAETSPEPFTGKNAYTGNSDALNELNATNTGLLYRSSGATYQSIDFRGYYQWSRPVERKKARPLYPTFGTTYDIAAGRQVYPSANNDLNDCTFYTDAARTVRSAESFYVNGFCEASCYTPEQEILFSDGYDSILSAVSARRQDMVTLTPDSSMDNIQLKTGRTYSYTAELRDSTHPIVELKTQSGGQLRVTLEHPVVNGEGRLVTAQTLKEGDELLRSDGTTDRITSIKRTEHFGKVYNLRPATEDRVSNLLVAEGFVVGSSLFQNDEVNYINRVILHSGTPAEVIP